MSRFYESGVSDTVRQEYATCLSDAGFTLLIGAGHLAEEQGIRRRWVNRRFLKDRLTLKIRINGKEER